MIYSKNPKKKTPGVGTVKVKLEYPSGAAEQNQPDMKLLLLLKRKKLLKKNMILEKNSEGVVFL